MGNMQIPLVMEEVTDPEELARARAQRERFDRNTALVASARDGSLQALSWQVHLRCR